MAAATNAAANTSTHTAPAIRAVRRFFWARRRSIGGAVYGMDETASCRRGRHNAVMAAVMHPAVLGIDVGGTKTAAAMVEEGRRMHQVEQATPLETTGGVIDCIEKTARDAIATAGTEPA